MVNAVVARQQGDQFQARIFWVHASALLHPDHPNVIEVSYEADGPKGFDDVVVRYNPPHRGTTYGRVPVHHYQVKYHVVTAGRFGFANLIDPTFTGGTAFSILQRLVEAKKVSLPGSAFTLVTTDRIADGDPLLDLISAADRSLRLDKLFVAGKDRSRMGQVRKLWRDHLDMDDAQLRELLENFHIHEGHKTLDEMREEVNDRFRVVGLMACRDSIEFRYDGAALELKMRGLNNLNRVSFKELAITESWLHETKSEDFLSVAIRSFSDGVAADLDSGIDNRLSLLEHFTGRYLVPGADWNETILPEVTNLLDQVREDGRRLRLTLNAHASIAFLAGTLLGTKSGANVELVQRGRAPTSVWRADDLSVGPPVNIATETIGDGTDVALVVSLSRHALADVRDYISQHQPGIGRVMHAVAQGAPGQGAVNGGHHSATLADQIADGVRSLRLPVGARVHVFITGPNAFSFFLGQHRGAMGPCVVYEYDFERRVHGSYEPTFRID